MATDPKILFGGFWIASVLGLFLDWLVWRGNKKYTELYLHLYSVLPRVIQILVPTCRVDEWFAN